MPVRKLRSVEEVSAPVSPPLAEENLRAAFEPIALCRWLRPWTTPRGVYRYRSIEEAQAQRQRWERAEG